MFAFPFLEEFKKKKGMEIIANFIPRLDDDSTVPASAISIVKKSVTPPEHKDHILNAVYVHTRSDVNQAFSGMNSGIFPRC